MYRPQISNLNGGCKDPVKLANEPAEDQRTFIDDYLLFTTPKEQTHTDFSPLVRRKVIIKEIYNKNKNK